MYTNTSRKDLGLIQQKVINGQHGSHFLSAAETRYAVTELDMLAVSMICKLFLAGLQHFKVITDHSPLSNTHRLYEIENPQLQHLKSCITGYNFTA